MEGPHRGPLDNDGLAEDNVRYATVEVREKVPVLVIDGDGARGRDENKDSFFIKNAIISVPGASHAGTSRRPSVLPLPAQRRKPWSHAFPPWKLI